jgi:processing peptidase subunit alpha
MSKQLSSAIARHVLPFTRRANNITMPLISRMNKHQQASLQSDDFIKVFAA